MAWKARQKHVLPAQKIPRQGLFHNAWENKFPYRFPEPGAQAYAFESLGLVEFTPIGPSVPTVMPIVPLEGPQLLVGQAVTVVGLPTQAGGIVNQPLVDPSAGYVAGMPEPVQQAPPNTPYPM